MPSSFPTLQTKRLVLRQLLPRDAQKVYEIRSNQEVGKHLSRPLAKSIQDGVAHINKIASLEKKGDCIYWVMSAEGISSYLGSITLWNFNENRTVADIGYELLPEYQGKGYVTESIESIITYGKEHLNLDKIIAVTVGKNVKSIRLLEKFNFNLEATNTDGSVEYSLLL